MTFPAPRTPADDSRNEGMDEFLDACRLSYQRARTDTRKSMREWARATVDMTGGTLVLRAPNTKSLPKAAHPRPLPEAGWATEMLANALFTGAALGMPAPADEEDEPQLS